jgi:DNA-binding transcriptional regulator YdaS (Cro superfamily)
MLRAAAEILGGDKALARHLGVSETVLSIYMTGSRELPDPLLLRAVDVILEERQSRHSVGAQAVAKDLEGSAGLE